MVKEFTRTFTGLSSTDVPSSVDPCPSSQLRTGTSDRVNRGLCTVQFEIKRKGKVFKELEIWEKKEDRFSEERVERDEGAPGPNRSENVLVKVLVRSL